MVSDRDHLHQLGREHIITTLHVIQCKTEPLQKRATNLLLLLLQSTRHRGSAAGVVHKPRTPQLCATYFQIGLAQAHHFLTRIVFTRTVLFLNVLTRDILFRNVLTRIVLTRDVLAGIVLTRVLLPVAVIHIRILIVTSNFLFHRQRSIVHRGPTRLRPTRLRGFAWLRPTRLRCRLVIFHLYPLIGVNRGPRLVPTR